MKKTFNANIAGIIFNIEEDAYAKLSEYLDSVKKHFAGQENSDEIINDIEARVAEHFIQTSDKEKIVSIQNVEALIAKMGEVEDFDDKKDNSNSEAQPNRENKKLFRDPDDKIVAGVASGLAAYFGLDTVLVRIVFFLLVISGGFGVAIYLVLWLVVPEAKNSAEKMQMRGTPINLKDVQESVKKRVAEVKESGSSQGGKALRGLGKVVRALILLIGKLVGIFGTLLAFILLFGLTFSALNLLFNAHAGFVQFPLAEVVHGPLYHIVILLGYSLALIPLIVFIIFALSLIHNRSIFSGKTIGGLSMAWVILAMIAGLVTVRHAAEWRDKIYAMPRYQITTQTYDIKDFTKLDLHGVDKITVKQGDQYKISATGRGVDIERVQFENRNNALVFTQRSMGKMCYFCGGRDDIDVEITMPKIESINIGGFTELKTEGLTSDNLNVTMTGSSRATINAHLKTLSTTLNGASKLILNGDSEKFDTKLDGASFLDALNFSSGNINSELHGASYARVLSTKTLNIEAHGSSQVAYSGNPQIDKTLSGGSSVVKAGDKDDKYEEYGY